MNPLDGPVNTSPQATGGNPGPLPAQTNSPLDPVGQAGAGAKPATPPDVMYRKGPTKIAAEEESSKLLLPVAAVAAVFYVPESFLGKKALTLLTGFKAGEAGALSNKVGPGALLFLAPEPLGVLPERFFSEKPKLPGTNVYLDPLYNYTRYSVRKEDRKRTAAGEAQRAELERILPTFPTENVSHILNNSDLRKEFIGFVDARVLDSILLQELQRRRAAEPLTPEQAAAAAAARANEDRERFQELAVSFAVGDFYQVAAVAGYLQSQAALSAPTAGNPLDPFATPIEGGSIPLALIRAVIGAAIRNEANAKGINRELVSERVDP